MPEIRLNNGKIIRNPERRIREYCRIEIYSGYDDEHRIDNQISPDDITAANRLYARIGRRVSEEIIRSHEIRKTLSLLGDFELGAINDEQWGRLVPRIYNLIAVFCSIRGVGLAITTKILHLKRPRLIPILDSFVVKFLLGVDIQNLANKSILAEVGVEAINVIRRDLRENEKAFVELQDRLEDLPIPLTNVRLYDILVWTTEKWDIRKDRSAPYGPPHGQQKSRIKTGKDKTDDSLIWVNIDKPTRKFTIHSDSLCGFVRKKRETRWKGVERLKRDGGWLSFSSLADADDFRPRGYSSYKQVRHC